MSELNASRLVADKHLFGTISKVDEELRIVAGWASTEERDSQGEVITRAAISNALPDYAEWGNIREMHGNVAAGSVTKSEMRDKGLWIEAYISDDQAWRKVVSKTYKGFSVGGSVISRDTVDKSIITAMNLVEISLVDRPANPLARIELFKRDSSTEEIMKNHTAVSEAEKIEKTMTATNPTNPTADESVLGGPPQAQDAQAAGSDSAGAEDTAKAAAPAGEEVAKGMYEVGMLADVLSQIQSLQACAEWEEEIEGDGSKMPDQLKAWLKTGGALLSSMVAEEVAEQTASDNTPDVFAMSATPNGDAVEKGALDELGDEMDVFEILINAESLAKSEAGKEIAKGFVDLGTAARDAVAKAEEAKAVLTAHVEAIAKAEATLKSFDEALVAKRNELDAFDRDFATAADLLLKQRTAIADMEARMAELAKTPVPLKAARTLTKGEDASSAPVEVRRASEASAMDAMKKALSAPKKLDGLDMMRLRGDAV